MPKLSTVQEHAYRLITHALLGILTWMGKEMYYDVKKLRCTMSQMNTRLSIIEAKAVKRR